MNSKRKDGINSVSTLAMVKSFIEYSCNNFFFSCLQIPHHFTSHGLITEIAENSSIHTLIKIKPVNSSSFSFCILQKSSHFSSESISIIFFIPKWEYRIKFKLPANYTIDFQNFSNMTLLDLLCQHSGQWWRKKSGTVFPSDTG